VSTQDTPEGRSRIVAGLRELADLLEADPSLPVPYAADLQAGPTGDDLSLSERRAKVRVAAQHLGVEVTEKAANGAREAVRHFGPIRYLVYAAGPKAFPPGGERVVPADEDFGECLDERMVAERDVPQGVSA
jgi:hypothetical protein